MIFSFTNNLLESICTIGLALTWYKLHVCLSQLRPGSSNKGLGNPRESTHQGLHWGLRIPGKYYQALVITAALSQNSVGFT